MQHLTISSLALGALLATACASNTSDSSTEYQAELTDSVASVQSALSQHHEHVLAATDLHQIGTLEQQHLQMMTTDIAHMQAANNGLTACGAATQAMGGAIAGHMGAHMGQGANGFTAMQSACRGMTDIMQQASSELDRHVHAMQSAPDLATARAEEHHYMSAMDPLAQHMQQSDQDIGQAMLRLQDAGYSMMCSASGQLHHGSQ